jgi:serine/threonine protein kinase
MVRPGDVVCNRYLLREQIGEGGMGVVYLADEPALARTVAIKILHPRLLSNRDVVAAFREEAVAASRVRHPSCVAIIEHNRLHDGTPVIVMEHVPGRALSRLIAEEPIPLTRAIDLMTQILGALEATHTAGVVHADIKSDNFLVETVDGGDHVTLIDFGLARMDGAVPFEGMVSGTPEYLAPELIRGGHPTPASDLYGAGVILYELLTGTTPFSGGSTTEILGRQLADIVVPPSLRCPERELPGAFDHVVMRALDKRPEVRFADAGELQRALRAALRSRPTREPHEQHWDRAVPLDTPTRNCTPQPRQRFARGSDHQIGAFERLRRRIGDALLQGDVGAIETGYLSLASMLAKSRQFAAAVRELEEGMDLLGEHTSDQLAVALAALYEEAGQRQRARRLAAHADQRRTLAG